MNRSDIFHLSNALSRHITLDDPQGKTGCDGTLRHTLHYLQAHNLDQATWEHWLHERGAWCDCGVVAEVLLWDPGELGDATPVAPSVTFRNWPPQPE